MLMKWHGAVILVGKYPCCFQFSPLIGESHFNRVTNVTSMPISSCDEQSAFPIRI